VFDDIGQFTDHQVMALGGGKVWVNGQDTSLEPGEQDWLVPDGEQRRHGQCLD
jgi:hypothetical protein